MGKNPFGGGCKKSPRPVNIDANHLLTQHHESAQPGADVSCCTLVFFVL